MSLSGALAFLLYKAFYPLARKYFRPGWRYLVLKAVLVFYLVPLPLLLSMIRDAVKRLADQSSPDAADPMARITQQLVVYADAVASSLCFTVLLYVSIGFGTVSLVMICFQVRNYIRERRKCLRSGYDLPRERFQKEAEEVGCRRKVRFMASPQAGTPFAIGVLKPVVSLPVDMMEAEGEAVSMCVKHELTHIRKGDLIYRLLALAAVCVHWFNPVCHWFRKELIVVSEICCDHDVLGTLPRSRRKGYYDALLSTTGSPQPPFQNKFLSTFVNDSQKELRRRILELEVMDVSKRKSPAVFSCTVILLAGLVSTLAYVPPVIHHIPFLDRGGTLQVFEPEHSSIDDIPTFPPASNQGQATKNDLALLDPQPSAGSASRSLPFARYFAAEDGTVFEAAGGMEEPDCVHEFASGTLVEHMELSGGKCAETYYKGERCAICGFTVRGVRVLQTSPGKCGHDFAD